MTTEETTRLAGWPAFVRELDATLAVHSQYILWGNLHDSFYVDEVEESLSLRELLWRSLRQSGYSCLIVYDQVDGLRVHAGDESVAAALFHRSIDKNSVPSFAGLRPYLRALDRQSPPVRAAFVIDYASRIARDATELTPEQKDFFVFCEKLSRTVEPTYVKGDRPWALYNPIIWLTEGPADLPAWLTADNHKIREISVPRPHLGDRQRAARRLARQIEEGSDGAVRIPNDAVAAFALQAEGLTLQEMIDVTRIARERGHAFDELPDAVQTYKLGVLDNPWRREHLRGRIVEGEERVPARVVGQPQAITKTLDILKRAVLGLSGAQAASTPNRPRGVLFFAGPTGVGKTELAKAITSLVFGDEGAYLRFDMSEFSDDPTGYRLMGSPTGYVGSEAGGELTNAVRQDPFRVILFDEIEKAHPRILDKFLQILEDGRLTDGRGSTVFFSETVLVFTSNLGTAGIEPAMPYEEIEDAVRTTITRHFTNELNRPELLNRFGDNIVVFDFIRGEAAARIFEMQLANIQRRVCEEHDLKLTISGEAADELRGRCTSDLSKGGRGIGMALESYFVNPLARALFERGRDEPLTETAEVTRIHWDGGIVRLDLE